MYTHCIKSLTSFEHIVVLYPITEKQNLLLVLIEDNSVGESNTIVSIHCIGFYISITLTHRIAEERVLRSMLAE